MEETKTMKTPMSSSIKLDKDEKGKCIDSTMYRGMIGSLLYLTASRPDIMYGGGLHNEVSYYEAFLIDSIMIGRQIHLGYLMMMHLILCCESTNHVLPYGRFLTRVFKDVGGNLSRETDFEVPNTYDTYDDQSMGKMKFEKAWDGSWAPLASNHAPWMDLSTQISSIGTCIEELTVRIEHIEDHLEHQHEEMMAHLLFVFPPPPPQP
ncbi:hypothetical protein CK203_108598 [Vitis vinifera]|uniref:Retrovirus-related Pol polyprotein from transposon RE1 n=1 Tax=Vitis vinifera TaxID=29760 RepID=A0A438CY71_VITVI|nr:hypothetical protein CK203_108598 [Vitis vinifera]